MIEQTAASGMPKMIVDNRRALADAASESNDEMDGGACGCNSGTGPAGALALARCSTR